MSGGKSNHGHTSKSRAKEKFQSRTNKTKRAERIERGKSK